MKPKKVLLLGSYGQSNLGDDLLMWNYLQLLRERGFEEIYVNANTTELIPTAVKQAFPNLHILNTYQTSLAEYIKLIRKVDCVVYGGGTLYKELYASTGRSPYSVIFRLMAFNVLARLLGTKLYHLNIGIGSLKTSLGRWITKRALNAARLSIFRDQKSYDFAKNTLGISDKKIQKSVDGLFLSRVWQQSWREQKLPIERTKFKQIIGLNVLSDIPDWVDRDDYIHTMKRAVNQLLDDGNCVVFTPFQHEFNPRNDLAFMHEEFAEELAREGALLIEEVPIDLATSYLQQCDVFMGMRFHSLLLATAARVPFVAVAYDTKCWRFVQEASYPHAIQLEKLTTEKLLAVCQQIQASSSETKQQLDAIAAHTYQEAEGSLRTLNL